MTSVNAGFTALRVPAGQSLTPVMPSLRRGGIEILGEGGHITLGSGKSTGAINFKGDLASLVISGQKIDLPPTPVGLNGIGLWGRCPNVRIGNSRVTGVTGSQDEDHGDGIQVGDDAEIDTLVIENTTICAGYQGIISHRRPDGRGVQNLILRNVNIRDQPERRSQPRSIALLLGDKPTTGPKSAPYNILLDNVWVDWMSDGHMLQLPVGAIVGGTIQRGVPPRGDFCPA